MDRRSRSPERPSHREGRTGESSRRRERHDRDRRPRRSRSRSPAHRDEKASPSRHERHGDVTSRRSTHEHSGHGERHRDRKSKKPVELPFSARLLSKSDLPAFEPLFASYLDLQKQKYIEDMDDREVRGRWKSFMGKWNRGELAAGWYDPEMFTRYSAEYSRPPRRTQPEEANDDNDKKEAETHGGEASDDDDYGPILPTGSKERAGPGIPSLQDLSLRAELDEEERQDSREALRAARKSDRALQKERLEELVPRADPGTRERKLEKRAMVNEKMRGFRDKSPGMEGGDEREVMGGGDSLEEYKRMKERDQRRKTEREIRREEIERAKQEEMEERRKAWREREEGTVGMLKELARQRFG